MLTVIGVELRPGNETQSHAAALSHCVSVTQHVPTDRDWFSHPFAAYLAVAEWAASSFWLSPARAGKTGSKLRRSNPVAGHTFVKS